MRFILRWLALALVAGMVPALCGCGSSEATAPDQGQADVGPPFDWTLSTLPPEAVGCGDGILDPGESCDDGSRAGEDSCDQCLWRALCGNGIVEGDEACDDGNGRNGDGCRASCELELCGDGKVDAPAEDCEGTGRCALCQAVATCGDGVLSSSERCDDGNTRSWDGCSGRCDPETVYLFSDLEFLTLPSAGCDFSGTGASQNAIGRALVVTAFAWNAYLDDQFRDVEQRPVFATSGWLPALTATQPFRVGLVDATVTDPLLRQVTPAAGNFDYAHAQLVGDVITSEAADIRLLAAGAIIIDQPLRRAQFKVRVLPDSTQPRRIEGTMCGVVEARALASAQDLFASASPNGVQTCAPIERLLSMTDLLAGGRLLGFAPTPVDVDLDGDGLETLIVAGTPRDGCLPVVVGCVEGDGTVIEDPNCVFDFDDGWSSAFGFSGDQATYVAP